MLRLLTYGSLLALVSAENGYKYFKLEKMSSDVLVSKRSPFTPTSYGVASNSGVPFLGTLQQGMQQGVLNPNAAFMPTFYGPKTQTFPNFNTTTQAERTQSNPSYSNQGSNLVSSSLGQYNFGGSSSGSFTYQTQNSLGGYEKGSGSFSQNNIPSQKYPGKNVEHFCSQSYKGQAPYGAPQPIQPQSIAPVPRYQPLPVQPGLQSGGTGSQFGTQPVENELQPVLPKLQPWSQPVGPQSQRVEQGSQPPGQGPKPYPQSTYGVPQPIQLQSAGPIPRYQPQPVQPGSKEPIPQFGTQHVQAGMLMWTQPIGPEPQLVVQGQPASGRESQTDPQPIVPLPQYVIPSQQPMVRPFVTPRPEQQNERSNKQKTFKAKGPTSTGSNEGNFSMIPGEPDKDYPILTGIPETSFRCEQQPYPGHYADVETRCQVFHICANNKTYDFLCPNGTIFSQQLFVCVIWNLFDCNTANSLYELNAIFCNKSNNTTESQESDESGVDARLLTTKPSGGTTKNSEDWGSSLDFSGTKDTSDSDENYADDASDFISFELESQNNALSQENSGSRGLDTNQATKIVSKTARPSGKRPKSNNIRNRVTKPRKENLPPN